MLKNEKKCVIAHTHKQWEMRNGHDGVGEYEHSNGLPFSNHSCE